MRSPGAAMQQRFLKVWLLFSATGCVEAGVALGAIRPDGPSGRFPWAQLQCLGSWEWSFWSLPRVCALGSGKEPANAPNFGLHWTRR